jgi:hypothetical protein
LPGGDFRVTRFPVRFVLAAGQLCLAVAMGALLASARAPGLALLYSAWRGASSGSWMVAGAALGPLPFGLACDLLGGYDPAIAALLARPIAATAAVLRAKPPALERPTVAPAERRG